VEEERRQHKRKNSDHRRTATRSQKCKTRPKPGFAQAFSGATDNSVQALAATLLALHFLGVTLNSGSSLALALGGRLFVELAAADFSQNTGFFAGALETTQSYVEGFVLFNFDGWHPGRTFTVLPNGRRDPARAREYVGFQGLRILTPRAAECKASDRKALAGPGDGDYHARLLL
jgi:hypothetical protein